MKTKLSLFIFSVVFFTFISCEVETTQNPSQNFFDIKIFLKKELAELSHLKSIKKEVTINDKIDERTLDTFNLKNDFEIFRNSNINKVAWLDKYKVDSLLDNSGELNKLKYTAISSNLKTQKFTVNYTLGEIDSISIYNASNNKVSSIKQYLKYFPKKGYSIESVQDITFGNQQNLKVKVTF